jgi:hypothetical protein
MIVATLPDYPALESPSQTGLGDRPRFLNRRSRFIVDLVLVAVIGAILCGSRELRRGIDRPWLERDLRHVYEMIPARYDYQRLNSWCGLVESDATKSELAAIQDAILAAPDRREYWCSPLARDFVITGIRSCLPNPSRWIRLNSQSDSNQWIGVGIVEDHESIRVSLPHGAYGTWVGMPQYFESSKTNCWIVCRVPMNF